MDSSDFKILLNDKFPFDATSSQNFWLGSIVDFLFSQEKHVLYLLKGYAGTGKSTLIGHLVKFLSKANFKFVLMAPTGRAAKVIAGYSNKKAFTIHKQIYYTKAEKGSGVKFVLKPNKFKNTLFIIDEASMIGDDRQSAKLFENGSLLDDLMQYVDAGSNCKLLLVGDPAQLPPVHLTISPALDADYLERQFNKVVTEWELKEVVRQQQDSSILLNATQLRNQMGEEHLDSFSFDLSVGKEIQRLQDGNEILELLDDALRKDGLENTVFIVRSNKRANLYNQQIRAKIRWQENEISAGDMLMDVRNNYYWLDDSSKAGFIANGDILEVVKIKETLERYGFRFAKASVKMADYPDEKELEVILLLETLTSESPAITYEQYQKLYKEVGLDYKGQKEINKKIKEDEFFNALQIKFAYAITCHKSQGGQWENVFVDLGYFTEDMLDKSYLRWLYTAMTKASKKLYLINLRRRF